MKIKFLHLLTVILLLTSCAKQPAFYESEMQANDSRTTGAVRDIRWGYHGNQLLFVVFQTSIMGESHTDVKINPITAPKNADVVIPHYEHWIQLPDGTQKDLPSSRMMFEYGLGGATFTKRSIDVTLDEFREWLASRPETYSIGKLEEFVTQQRKHI